METESEIPENQKASLGSPLMDCCASSIITEDVLRALGFVKKDKDDEETQEMWTRDGVEVWEFNDYGWLVDALDQAMIDVTFTTLGELDAFWRACRLPPILHNNTTNENRILPDPQNRQ
jgi:hypothetical protein